VCPSRRTCSWAEPRGVAVNSFLLDRNAFLRVQHARALRSSKWLWAHASGNCHEPTIMHASTDATPCRLMESPAAPNHAIRNAGHEEHRAILATPQRPATNDEMKKVSHTDIVSNFKGKEIFTFKGPNRFKDGKAAPSGSAHCCRRSCNSATATRSTLSSDTTATASPHTMRYTEPSTRPPQDLGYRSRTSSSPSG